MVDIEASLKAAGGVASSVFLMATGVDRRELERAVRVGRVNRVRQGWIASLNASDDVVQAVRVGGSLSCQSVLRRHGVWCDEDRLLHVRVGKHTTHLSAPHNRRLPLGRPGSRGVRIHRSVAGLRELRPIHAVDTIDLAVLHLFQCEPRDNIVVSLDSVLNKGLLTRARLENVTSVLPQKQRSYLLLTDSASQSGLESKARLGLHRRGIAYRSQVFIQRVGHVDLLVGDRLVVEVDGRAWHSGPLAYSEDRRRDLELVRQGYLVLRLSYGQVMNQWHVVEETIRTLIARREHTWAIRHRHVELGVVETGGVQRARGE